MLIEGEFEAAKVEDMEVFQIFSKKANVRDQDELTKNHEEQLAHMAMTMDTELFKMKQEYEKKVIELEKDAKMKSKETTSQS